ncbi:glycosyl transferase, group 1 family protein [Synechococcus sp. PCC 7335]|uniref:glycosyltransferase n=1 Tax=Synechococcus sp. (strain ATCC 29403 / PCC 7335) TaxID=91464 RepID=UPI00017ECB4A|nr:glycosyltransferase [Synechococcus sp. PCC 7335]EDX87368.1 glycosyl transferase, group 1 family protein [Synechococcus sp. PCC 7335]
MSEKLRIAFVVGQFPMLSETFVMNQATGLLARGHEVDIYTEQLCDTSSVHPDVTRYNLLERTYVLPPVPDNYLLRLGKGVGLVAKHIYRHPKQTLQSLNVFRYGMQVASLRMLFANVPRSNPIPYDIIHAQFGTLGFRGLLLRELNRGSRLIVMFRGSDISQWVKSQGDHVYDTLFSQADYFLTNCDFFRQKLLALGCPSDRLKVHYSGLDCSKFQPVLRRLDASDKIRIAATGRLVEKKGFEYCIRAVAKVAKQYPQITFDIMGDGPLHQTLAKLIESLQMTEVIHLRGWQNEEEIIDTLARAHLFVAPSVTASNGNQDAPINVLKEAMALGLPVVSTYHGGIPELVEDGVSGLLVPERDADAIAQALTTLIEHPERWPDMGKAGRAYVEAHYNLSALNDRLVTIYQQLKAGPAGDQPSNAEPNEQTATHIGPVLG